MKSFKELTEQTNKKDIVSFINSQLKGKSKSYSHDSNSNGWIVNKGEQRVVPFLNKLITNGGLFKGKYWGQNVMGKKTWILTARTGSGEIFVSSMSNDGKLLDNVEVRFRLVEDAVLEAKNFTRKGGNGDQVEWLITLENGKTKKVKADSKANAKELLSSSQLIIGVKSIKEV